MLNNSFEAGSLPGIAPNLTSLDQCTLELCSIKYGQITYDPTLVGNALYLGIFGAILLVQPIQMYLLRTWTYSGAMMGGMILEIIGYLGRVLMHFNPFRFNPFLLNLIFLTIGPVFMTAALYLTLSRIIPIYGTQYSRIPPKAYTLTFITCDIVALILQSAGGALAAIADNQPDQDSGVDVMISGLAFQVACILTFALLATEFFWKVSRSVGLKRRGLDGGKEIGWMLIGLTTATILILIRSAFRVAELSDGFTGDLANEEIPFMIFEGVMIISGSVLMTVFQPGRYIDFKKVKGGNVGGDNLESGHGQGSRDGSRDRSENGSPGAYKRVESCLYDEEATVVNVEGTSRDVGVEGENIEMRILGREVSNEERGLAQ